MPLTIHCVASRNTGVAPLAVLLDASETTAEFHQLHFKWNFEDDNAGNWTMSGKLKIQRQVSLSLIRLWTEWIFSIYYNY